MGKAKRIMLKWTKGQEISKECRKMLKGFYTNNKYEIDPFHTQKNIEADKEAEKNIKGMMLGENSELTKSLFKKIGTGATGKDKKPATAAYET